MFKKFIKNIRFGFATNSSSSHSFVYYKNQIGNENYDGDIDTDFGWNKFRLANIYEKLMYVLTQKIGGTWENTHDDVLEMWECYHKHFPELTIDDFQLAMNGYVDHQSQSSMTLDELLALARNPHVIIYGGNDNDGEYFERDYEYYDNEEDKQNAKQERLNTFYEAPAIDHRFFY